MVYMKHSEHGNVHVEDAEVSARVADGWVVWPRSKEAKAPKVTAIVMPVNALQAKRAYIRKA